MHIEPGVLNATKILAANAAAIATLGPHVRGLVRVPADLVKTLLAAVFFSVFMQMLHMPVGASELHFVGASAIYFLFGFRPALFGFALGLLLQAVVFAPQDLLHIGVNSLSLMVPLIGAHALQSRRKDASPIGWQRILRFDAPYYAGVAAMVGFWLSLGSEPASLAAWLVFAAAYVPIVLLEPAFTWAVLRAVKTFGSSRLVREYTQVASLQIA